MARPSFDGCGISLSVIVIVIVTIHGTRPQSLSGPVIAESRLFTCRMKANKVPAKLTFRRCTLSCWMDQSLLSKTTWSRPSWAAKAVTDLGVEGKQAGLDAVGHEVRHVVRAHVEDMVR